MVVRPSLLLFFFIGYAALVDSLVSKTRTWEQDNGITFAYDGVPLLAMLDEYVLLRHDREEEKKRMRVGQICPCMNKYSEHVWLSIKILLVIK